MLRAPRCIGLAARVAPTDIAKLGFGAGERWQRRKAWTAYRQAGLGPPSWLLFHGPLWHGQVSFAYQGREHCFEPSERYPVQCRQLCPSTAGRADPDCGTLLAHATCYLHPLQIRSFVEAAARQGVAVAPKLWDVCGRDYPLLLK